MLLNKTAARSASKGTMRSKHPASLGASPRSTPPAQWHLEVRCVPPPLPRGRPFSLHFTSLRAIQAPPPCNPSLFSVIIRLMQYRTLHTVTPLITACDSHVCAHAGNTKDLNALTEASETIAVHCYHNIPISQCWRIRGRIGWSPGSWRSWPC